MKTILLLIFVSVFLIIPVSAFTHPGGVYCKYCHNKLNAPNIVKLNPGLCGRGTCHASFPNAYDKYDQNNPKPWYFRQQYSLHLRSTVCMRCHSKNTGNIHIVHNDIIKKNKKTCLYCHSPKGYSSKIVNVPEKNTSDPFVVPDKECGNCHRLNKGRVHDIHAPVLTKACPVCHGGGVAPTDSNAASVLGEKLAVKAGVANKGFLPVRVSTSMVDGIMDIIKNMITYI